MPEEVVSQVLFNEALRQRIALEPDINKQIEIVESALVESHRALSQELNVTRSEVSRRESEIKQLQQLVNAREGDFRKQQEAMRQKDEKIKLLEQKLQKIESKTVELQRILQEKQREDEVGAARRGFVYKIIMSLLGILLLVVTLTVFSHSFIAIATWQIFVGYLAFTLIAWIEFVDRRGTNAKHISEWMLFARFHSIKKWLFSGLGFILIALIENAIGDMLWEPLKQLLLK